MPVSINPYKGAWTNTQVIHLLKRTMFGAKIEDISYFQKRTIAQAIDELWAYTGEMFIPADFENQLGIDFATIEQQWVIKVQSVFNEATLSLPVSTFMQTGGKQGTHTEQLGFILSELQYLQRAYPNSEW